MSLEEIESVLNNLTDSNKSNNRITYEGFFGNSCFIHKIKSFLEEKENIENLSLVSESTYYAGMN